MKWYRKIKFLNVNADGKLPFPDHYFDLVYTKKGLGCTKKPLE